MPSNRVTFVCVGNAGRSQMATAFAERERDKQELDIDIVTGGTDPADHIHAPVVDVMRERNIDINNRTPRKITPDDIKDTDYVITMGCSVDAFCPANWIGEIQRWNLTHLGGNHIDSIRAQRHEIEYRVIAFFDMLEARQPWKPGSIRSCNTGNYYLEYQGKEHRSVGGSVTPREHGRTKTFLSQDKGNIREHERKNEYPR